MPRSLSSTAVPAAIRTGSYAQVQLHDRDALGWRYVLLVAAARPRLL